MENLSDREKAALAPRLGKGRMSHDHGVLTRAIIAPVLFSLVRPHA